MQLKQLTKYYWIKIQTKYHNVFFKLEIKIILKYTQMVPNQTKELAQKRYAKIQ